MRYVVFSDRPTFDITLVKQDTESIQSSLSSTLTSIQINLTSPLQSFLTTESVNQTPQISLQPIAPSTVNTPSPTTSPMGFEIVPTSSIIHPTTSFSPPTPFPTSLVATPYQTQIPKPTTVQPTKKPTSQPSPTLEPVKPQRPGNNYEEMLAIAAKNVCVPAAMFKAIGESESGGKINSLSGQDIILFNRQTTIIK